MGAQVRVVLVDKSGILSWAWLGWSPSNAFPGCPLPSPGLPMYMKSLRWALAVMAVLLAVSTVAIVALASRAGMVPPPSPLSSLAPPPGCLVLTAPL